MVEIHVITVSRLNNYNASQMCSSRAQLNHMGELTENAVVHDHCTFLI